MAPPDKEGFRGITTMNAGPQIAAHARPESVQRVAAHELGSSHLG